ncbi:hypothetical protein LguiA_007236 [Lonicera macranthoides]
MDNGIGGFDLRIVHGMVLRFKLGNEPIMGNAMIDTYSRNARIEMVEVLFRNMVIKDVASWTSLLNGFIKCGDIQSAPERRCSAKKPTVEEREIDEREGTQASSCNKKRRVVTGKKTAAIVRTSGKSRMTYDPAVSRPPKEVRSRLVSDMSAFLKDRASMLYPTFGEMPLSERTMLFNYLSESCDIDPVDKALVTWIQKKAADRFKDWKYKIHKNWQA